jgi:hypothetical protein
LSITGIYGHQPQLTKATCSFNLRTNNRKISLVSISGTDGDRAQCVLARAHRTLYAFRVAAPVTGSATLGIHAPDHDISVGHEEGQGFLAHGGVELLMVVQTASAMLPEMTPALTVARLIIGPKAADRQSMAVRHMLCECMSDE